MNKASAEGKSTMGVQQNPSELIDALQYWGSVQGQLLLDWGLTEEEIPDPLMDYPIEGWVVGHWVIKAAINPDPLGASRTLRRPMKKSPVHSGVTL